MSSERKRDDLDKDARKRFDRLVQDWGKDPGSQWWSEKLFPSDLRLLLEHFLPLRELIQEIASSSRCEEEVHALSDENVDPDANNSTTDLPDNVLIELDEKQSQFDKQTKKLEECYAIIENLNKEIQELQNDKRILEEKLATQRAKEANTLPELDVLRSDRDLAIAVGLEELPKEMNLAIVKVVAVLAQHDNLIRLWTVLKDRCETGSRAASQKENQLLKGGLAWYNHNWPNRPFKLCEAEPGVPYDFKQHLRSRNTPNGEVISEFLLPGINDGGGKPICKVLVRTR